MGTGAESSLPFHAAGMYGSRESTNLDCCLFQSISSYTPSIKGLTYARKTAPNLSRERRSLLLVTMPTTPGHSALEGVSREEKAIASIVGQKCSVTPLAHPTARQVLNEIGGSSMVQFACHGHPDPLDLAQSHLLLQKENGEATTVDRLTRSALLDATTKAESWLADMSACSTAEVKMEVLADESLHLTSAFQMAGLAHVIGSLLPADDETCVQIAKHFYSFLNR